MAQLRARGLDRSDHTSTAVVGLSGGVILKGAPGFDYLRSAVQCHTGNSRGVASLSVGGCTSGYLRDGVNRVVRRLREQIVST